MQEARPNSRAASTESPGSTAEVIGFSRTGRIRNESILPATHWSSKGYHSSFLPFDSRMYPELDSFLKTKGQSPSLLIQRILV